MIPRWLGLFGRRKPPRVEDDLRATLFQAIERGDLSRFERICAENRSRILERFPAWRTVPPEQRSDSETIMRYGETLIAVAAWFSRQGDSRLEELLDPPGPENPIHRWAARFGEADRLKEQQRWPEAIVVLQDLADDMSKHKGTAPEEYFPMVLGSLGECHFRSGNLEDAYGATKAALNGCLHAGDVEGVITYCGNLVEICTRRGDRDEARSWLVRTTNAMIQAGNPEQAASIRRRHGLEPTEGFIDG